MNYELAKQLKDAGFPQISYIGSNDGERLTHHYESYYIPTLSELIGACGDDLAIIKFNDPMIHRVGHIQAISYPKRGVVLNAWTKTPEESVARLWLKLNKKDGGQNQTN